MKDKRERAHITWVVRTLSHIIATNPNMSEESQKNLHDTISNINLYTPAEHKFYKDQEEKEQANIYSSMAMDDNGVPTMSGLMSAPSFNGVEETDNPEVMRFRMDNLPDGPEAL